MNVFVPGALVNPMNDSVIRGHWSKHRRWSKTWREKAALCMLQAWGRRHGVDPAAPKRVRFIAFVGRSWDDDSIPAGCKPCRDALIDMRIIQGDGPHDGHVFEYAQVIAARPKRGVEIIVEPRA